MAKIFKKLFSGDTVATYDGKVVKKLTTEEPTESIVGTWVFNDTITKLLPQNTWYSVQFYSDGQLYYGMKYFRNTSSSNSYYWLGYSTGNSDSAGSNYAYNYSNNSWYNANRRTVEFITNIENETFITWFKANATKQ